ncbi:hypothetical protein ACLOJK_031907 [Asimina triloba]
MAEPLKGDVAPERFAPTMEEAAELEVCERGQKETTSKRSLALIKEEPQRRSRLKTLLTRRPRAALAAWWLVKCTALSLK